MSAHVLLFLIVCGQMIHGVMETEQIAIGAAIMEDGAIMKISLLKIVGKVPIKTSVIILLGVHGELIRGASRIVRLIGVEIAGIIQVKIVVMLKAIAVGEQIHGEAGVIINLDSAGVRLVRIHVIR